MKLKMEYDDLEFDNEDVDYDNEDQPDIYDEYGEVKEDIEEEEEGNEEYEEGIEEIEDGFEMEKPIEEKKTKSINKKDRITSRQMSSYEYDRINGILTELIDTTNVSPNSFKVHPLVFELSSQEGLELIKSEDIADFWLNNCKKIPFPIVLKRQLNDKFYEEWFPMEMILPNELDTNYMFDHEIDLEVAKIKQLFKYNMKIYA